MARQAELREPPSADRDQGRLPLSLKPCGPLSRGDRHPEVPSFSPASTPMVRSRAMSPISRA